MGKDDLVLTTYKVAVHTHSRTSHCKWLSRDQARQSGLDQYQDRQGKGHHERR